MKKIIILLLLTLMMFSFQSYGQSSRNNQAKAYFFAAQEAFDNGQYDDALTAIDKVESLLGKSNALLSALKVKTYFEQEQYIEAKAEIDVFFGFNAKEALAREVSSYLIKIDNGIEEQKRRREQVKRERLAREEVEKEKLAEEQAEKEKLAIKKAKRIAKEKEKKYKRELATRKKLAILEAKEEARFAKAKQIEDASFDELLNMIKVTKDDLRKNKKQYDDLGIEYKRFWDLAKHGDPDMIEGANKTSKSKKAKKKEVDELKNKIQRLEKQKDSFVDAYTVK